MPCLSDANVRTPLLATVAGKEEARFIADAMLGRLTTWLRLLGCDVHYFRKIEDKRLCALVLQQKRLLLTRDTGLARRRVLRGRCLLIRSDRWRDQVRQVVAECGIDPVPRSFSRCLRCNVALEAIPAAELGGRIPPYVAATQSRFNRCPGCGRIYWPATHRQRAMEELRAICQAEMVTRLSPALD